MTNMDINNSNNYAHQDQYEGMNLVPTEFHSGGDSFLSNESSEKVFESLKRAVDEGYMAVASAHYVYERRGYLSTTKVGNDINKSYGSYDDDVILQVTVRVAAHEVKDLVSHIIKEETSALEAALKNERAELDRQIEELQARRDNL